MEKTKKHFRILLGIYIVILVWAIILKMNLFHIIERDFYSTLETHRFFNPKTVFPKIPFPPRYFALDTEEGQVNILNILAFIPFGFLVSAISEGTRLWNAMLFSFLLSFAFEASQIFTAIGGFAVIDLMFNTLGGTVGFVVFAIFDWIRKQFRKETQDKITMGVISICYVCFVPVAVYGVAKTIYHIDFYLSLIEPMINSLR